jgi:hypothetical protein
MNILSNVISVALVSCLFCLPVTASAQSGPIRAMADTAVSKVVEGSPHAQPRPKGTAAVRGALIGAVAALAITGWAAASYGENEGGKFCYNCMLQWSALSVPVGAGLGAGIGVAVVSLRSSALPAERFPRRAAITISTRF